MLLLILLAAIFGACVGSFSNVIIIRLHQGEGIGGRSHCPHCRKTLQVKHLIPLVSWIALRAKCAFCRKPIHWQYPAVEMVGACIGVASLLLSMHDGLIDIGRLFFSFILFFVLLIITAFDLRWQLVPTGFVMGSAVLLGCLRVIVHGYGEILSVIGGALVCAAILFVIVWISGGKSMGDGDPFVAALIGASLGWPLGLIAIGLGFISGGVVAAGLLFAGRAGRKTPIPFVPFLAIGTVVAYFYQQPLLDFVHYALL